MSNVTSEWIECDARMLSSKAYVLEETKVQMQRQEREIWTRSHFHKQTRWSSWRRNLSRMRLDNDAEEDLLVLYYSIRTMISLWNWLISCLLKSLRMYHRICCYFFSCHRYLLVQISCHSWFQWQRRMKRIFSAAYVVLFLLLISQVFPFSCLQFHVKVVQRSPYHPELVSYLAQVSHVPVFEREARDHFSWYLRVHWGLLFERFSCDIEEWHKWHEWYTWSLVITWQSEVI